MKTVAITRRPRRIAHIGGLTLLACGMILMAVVVFPQIVGAKGSYVVLSGSMSPTIQAGDVVVSQSVDTNSVEQGDVIIFERPASDSNPDRTTHRVVNVVHRDDGLYFRTKGDANEQPDARLVPADHVVGSVWFHVPYLGRFLLFARTKTGLLSLVIAPCLLLVITEAYSLASAALSDARADDEDGDADESDEPADDSAQTNEEDR